MSHMLAQCDMPTCNPLKFWNAILCQLAFTPEILRGLYIGTQYAPTPC